MSGLEREQIKATRRAFLRTTVAGLLAAACTPTSTPTPSSGEGSSFLPIIPRDGQIGTAPNPDQDSPAEQAIKEGKILHYGLPRRSQKHAGRSKRKGRI